MDRRGLLALSSALVAGALAGCIGTVTAPMDDENRTADPGTGDDPGGPGVDPDGDDEALKDLVTETNGFAFDLYGELSAGAGDPNLLASPVSVSTALAMAYAGARGDTREEMGDALRYTLEEGDLHAAIDVLLGKLDSRGEDLDEDQRPSHYDEDDDPVPFQLRLVNAARGQGGCPFRAGYLETIRDHYGGELREVDFGHAESAREEINAWVADRTGDRIDDLLPGGALDALTRLVLTNAVCFHANWRYPFRANRTEDGDFTALDGSTATVPTMTQSERFPYAEVDGSKAVDLPYLGEEVSMLLVLPPEGEFGSSEEAVDAADLARITDALISTDAPEATAWCPYEGTADYYELRLEYQPDAHAVELMSSRDSLQTFRDETIGHEAFAKLVYLLEPRWLRLTVEAPPRSGLATTIRHQTGPSPAALSDRAPAPDE